MESHFTKAGQENTRLIGVTQYVFFTGTAGDCPASPRSVGAAAIAGVRPVAMARRSLFVASPCSFVLENNAESLAEVGTPAIIDKLLNLGPDELIRRGEETRELLP